MQTPSRSVLRLNSKSKPRRDEMLKNRQTMFSLEDELPFAYLNDVAKGYERCHFGRFVFNVLASTETRLTSTLLYLLETGLKKKKRI